MEDYTPMGHWAHELYELECCRYIQLCRYNPVPWADVAGEKGMEGKEHTQGRQGQGIQGGEDEG